MKNHFQKFAALALIPASFLATQAHAVAIDVGDVVSSITGDGVTAVGAIGAAILTLCGVVLVYKLVRRAM